MNPVLGSCRLTDTTWCTARWQAIYETADCTAITGEQRLELR